MPNPISQAPAKTTRHRVRSACTRSAALVGLLWLGVCTSPLLAQAGPTLPPTFSQVREPLGENVSPPEGELLAGDWNGDGRDDLWSLSEGRVWNGMPYGAFRELPPTPIPRLGRVALLESAVGDFNQDGRDDVILGGFFALSYWQGQATGGLLEVDPSLLPFQVSRTRAVFLVVDWDGDGDEDIFLSDADPAATLPRQTPEMWENTPTGLMPRSLTAGILSVQPVRWGSADLDADGRMDLAAVIDNGGQFELMRVPQTAMGTLGLPTFSPLTVSGSSFPTAFSVADYAADGTAEILIHTSTEQFLFEGFSAAPASVMPSGRVAWTGACDLFDDGDATPQLLRAGHHLEVAVVASGQTASLGLPSLPLPAGPRSLERVVLPGDFDGDSNEDLFLPDTSGSTLLLNQGNGSLRRVAPPAHGGMLAERFAVGDFNGDGFPDVATYEPARGLRIALNDGSARFLDRPVSDTKGLLLSDELPGSLESFDLDGNPELDLLLSWRPSATLVPEYGALVQDTSGAFAAGSAPIGGMQQATDEIQVTRVIDADGDGDLDILHGGIEGTSLSTPTLTVHFNIGGGNFAPRTPAQPTWPPQPGGPISFSHPSRDLAWLDFNGDGRQDIVQLLEWSDCIGGSGGPGTLRLWRQELSASFTFLADIPLAPTLAGTTALATGDLDGDGDDDVLVGSDAYLSNGVTLSALPVTAISGLRGSTTFTRLADIDGDSYPDAFTLDEGTLELRINDGTGRFGASRVILPVTTQEFCRTSLNKLAFADFDRDGRLDIVAPGPRILLQGAVRLQQRGIARIGDQLRLSLTVPANDVVRVFLAENENLFGPRTLPGLEGELGIDLSSLTSLGDFSSTTGTRVQLSIALPPSIAPLTGFVYHLQALSFNGPTGLRLSNREVVTLLPGT